MIFPPCNETACCENRLFLPLKDTHLRRLEGRNPLLNTVSSFQTGGGLAVGTVLLIGETQNQHPICDLNALFYTGFTVVIAYMEFALPRNLNFHVINSFGARKHFYSFKLQLQPHCIAHPQMCYRSF